MKWNAKNNQKEIRKRIKKEQQINEKSIKQKQYCQFKPEYKLITANTNDLNALLEEKNLSDYIKKARPGVIQSMTHFWYLTKAEEIWQILFKLMVKYNFKILQNIIMFYFNITSSLFWASSLVPLDYCSSR